MNFRRLKTEKIFSKKTTVITVTVTKDIKNKDYNNVRNPTQTKNG